MKKWILIALVFSFSLQAKEIYLWHAFEGFLEEKFCAIIADYNAQQKEDQIIPVYKGNYSETYRQGIDAAQEGIPPHILQVYEAATLSMMLEKGKFIPVGQLMKSYNHRFDPAVYMDVVRKFYSDPSGEMLSLPWNASTGILFYNKEAFRKAGLDPERPPQTWVEFEEMGQKLVQAGYAGYTTAWPAAYHLEHVCVWHDLPFGTASNGFEGLHGRLAFDQEAQIFHLQKLVEWQKAGLFSYSGRFAAEPEQKFAEGKCAILLQGANRLPLLERLCHFEIGVGFMPYWPHLKEKPQNLNIGGASFWVMNGFSDDEYEAVAAFFEYLSSTPVQADWHQATGYLPITDAAYHLTKKQGFYADHPAAEIAVLEVMENEPTAYSFGVRFGNYVEIRERIVDHIEKALREEMTPAEALHQAVFQGNVLLEQFEKEHPTIRSRL